MRYTEAKLAKFAQSLLSELERERLPVGLRVAEQPLSARQT